MYSLLKNEGYFHDSPANTTQVVVILSLISGNA
jgi:hypothetical protein